jgi:hypothetical protein
MPFWAGRQRVARRRAEEKAGQLMFDFGDEAMARRDAMSGKRMGSKRRRIGVM